MADETFRDWLRRRRKALDLTQDGLARKVGCSVSTVRGLEQGSLRPSRQLAELLAVGLDIAPTDRPAFVRLVRGSEKLDEKSTPPLRASLAADSDNTISVTVQPSTQNGHAAPAPDSALTNPYKGLQAFQEADAHNFFGREALIQRLCERLAERNEFARFLAVVGPSGSGKSSLVRAGLVPVLRRLGLPDGCGPVVVDVSPGPHPLEELEAALLRIAVNPPPSLLEQLQVDERGLVRAVKRVLPADEQRELLLLIDQFEELFTLVSDEQVRADFIDKLYTAVTDERSRIWVVITLRADFYDRPLLYAPSGRLLRQRAEVVEPLSTDEMFRAITLPAEHNGLELEARLVATIMQEVAEQPGALPLLQYTLSELYERRDGRLLTLAAYRASGGVFAALARRAESLFAALSAPQQAEARQLFLRLVVPEEGTRRRVPVVEVVSATRDEPALRHVLDLFTRYRMLTFDHDSLTAEPTVEIAHEAVLRNWPRLEGWLSESKEQLQLERKLLQASNDWQAAGQDKSYLATGRRLEQFESLAADSFAPRAVALNQTEQLFVALSLAEESQRGAMERERQTRELELTRQAAVIAQHAAAAQRSAANRLRVLALVLALFGLVAVGLTAWALQQRQAAQVSEQHAQANLARADALRLAAEATNLLSTHGDNSLIALLSIYSLNTQYTPQGAAELSAAAQLDYPWRQLHDLTDPKDGALSATFSSDGKYLLTGGTSSNIRIWDVAAAQIVKTFSADMNGAYSARFSPDGKLIANGSGDNSARVWDITTGKPILTIKQPAAVNCVDFSPDGKYLLTVANGIVALWDAASSQSIRHFTRSSANVSCAIFSPDGKFIAGVGGQAATLWDAATAAPIRDFAISAGELGGLAFAPDGRYLLTGGSDTLLRLWDVSSGKVVRLFNGHTGVVDNVAFSRDGKYILSGSRDTTVRLWDSASAHMLRVIASQTQAIAEVAFSPDGQLFASANNDGSAWIWHTETPVGETQFSGNSAALWQATLSPDGKKVLTAGADWTARVRDAASGQILKTLAGHTDEVHSAVFSPDGKSILTASADRTARLWDSASGKPLIQLDGHTDAISKAIFSPDGSFVVTASYDGTARVWNARSGTALLRFDNPTPVHLNDVSFSPGSASVATGGDDNLARIWNAQSGKIEMVFKGHSDAVWGVSFSPDGKQLLSAGADGTARLWDVGSGVEVQRFVGHSGAVYTAVSSADGKYVLTAGADNSARLWDARTGLELRRFSGHSSTVRSAIFSADGKSILTASADKTARLWFTDYHDTIHYLCDLLTRGLTAAEVTRYNINDPQPVCPTQ